MVGDQRCKKRSTYVSSETRCANLAGQVVGSATAEFQDGCLALKRVAGKAGRTIAAAGGRFLLRILVHAQEQGRRQPCVLLNRQLQM